MRRFRIRRTRHSVGRLQRAFRQTSLLMQRLQRERALRTRRARALPYPAPAGKGAAAPSGRWRRHTRRDPSAATIKRACFPQVNERLDCAPSKLARQQRHKRENKTAAASDPCSTSERTRRGDGFANSPRQEPFILSLGGQNKRFFATERAKRNDYSHRAPHSHEIPSKLSIPRLRKREESLVMTRWGQNERFFAIHAPRPTYAPLRASVQLVRSGHRAWRGR